MSRLWPEKEYFDILELSGAPDIKGCELLDLSITQDLDCLQLMFYAGQTHYELILINVSNFSYSRRKERGLISQETSFIERINLTTVPSGDYCLKIFIDTLIEVKFEQGLFSRHHVSKARPWSLDNQHSTNPAIDPNWLETPVAVSDLIARFKSL